MGLPGVPRVPISGPNRGMFSKLNDPGPLGPGGLSHTIFGNGRFQGSQRSFGCDVLQDAQAGKAILRQVYGKVWLLTQYYSVRIKQSRVGVRSV